MRAQKLNGGNKLGRGLGAVDPYTKTETAMIQLHREKGLASLANNETK